MGVHLFSKVRITIFPVRLLRPCLVFLYSYPIMVVLGMIVLLGLSGYSDIMNLNNVFIVFIDFNRSFWVRSISINTIKMIEMTVRIVPKKQKTYVIITKYKIGKPEIISGSLPSSNIKKFDETVLGLLTQGKEALGDASGAVMARPKATRALGYGDTMSPISPFRASEINALKKEYTKAVVKCPKKGCGATTKFGEGRGRFASVALLCKQCQKETEPKRGRPKKARRGRKPDSERAEIRSNALRFIRSNPNKTVAEIRHGLKLPNSKLPKLSKALSELAKARKVVRSGSPYTHKAK